MTDKQSSQAPIFDTDKQHLGNVYAKALFGFGQKKGELENLIDQLDGVVDGLGQSPQLTSLLESPRVSYAEKENLIDKAFGKKVSKDLLNFLKMAASKGRFDCMNAVRASAHKLNDELSGRVQATITTAEEVNAGVKKQIEDKLAKVLGKQVQLASEIDPAIIGGMIVRISDTVYDGSVVNQLNQVRSKAIKGATGAIRASIGSFTS